MGQTRRQPGATRQLWQEFIARRQWPRRRARLPGRGRLRELREQPNVPERLQQLLGSPQGQVAPTDRLIGLMMVRDEADVLAASLHQMTRWFDRILVLDGTTEPAARRRTEQILRSVPEVVAMFRDEQLPTDHVRDGARQLLLDEARRRYGTGNWIGILHADEFMDQDPRPLLCMHRPRLDPSLRVRLIHTFLHADDQANWAVLSELPVRERVTHLMWPGVPESRFFFDTGDRDYDIGRHSKVIPLSLRPGPLIDGFLVAQYNERSPEQLLARARSRADTDWQLAHYGRLLERPPEVFTASLDTPDRPFAPEFSNSHDGPPRVLTTAQLPLRIDDIRPTFVVAPDPGAATELHGQHLGLPLDATVLTHPLGYLGEDGGLLDLLTAPSRSRVHAFELRMRRFASGSHGWGCEAIGGPACEVPAHYFGALRYLTAALRSGRLAIEHKRTVAREFVLRTTGAVAGTTGDWCDIGSVPLHRVAELHQVFPTARIVQVIRNPPDSVEAWRRSGRCGDSLDAAAALVNRGYAAADSLRAKGVDIEVRRYEDLVSADGRAMRGG